MALVFWAVQAYRLETFNDWWWTFRFFVSCCVTQRPNNASEGKPCAVPGVQRRVTWAVKARIIRLASALTLLCACFTLSLLFLFCFVFFFLAYRYGRQSNVEALLGEVQTVFPSRGAFHLDYMLFGAASGCMGFDREAFALMLDQVYIESATKFGFRLPESKK